MLEKGLKRNGRRQLLKIKTKKYRKYLDILGCPKTGRFEKKLLQTDSYLSRSAVAIIKVY